MSHNTIEINSISENATNFFFVMQMGFNILWQEVVDEFEILYVLENVKV